jgi:hypothetical protein
VAAAGAPGEDLTVPRRASPVGVLAAFLLVCAAPLVVVVATGIDRAHPADDRTETAADEAPGDAAATRTGHASPPARR